MDMICDQYKRNTYFINNRLYYRTSPVIALYILEYEYNYRVYKYNYRVYNRKFEYKWDISNVHNIKNKVVGKLSPNYWFKSILLCSHPTRYP